MLIHGFWLVNARLLMAFGTAFYAITHVNCQKFVASNKSDHLKGSTCDKMVALHTRHATYQGIYQMLTWPRGYKTFFVLNSVEHEI